MEPHFIYAGYYYSYHEDKLRSFILKRMQKYKMKSAMVTVIYMLRFNLATKQKVEIYCNGKHRAGHGKHNRKESVNDDLESFAEQIRLGNLFRKEPEEKIFTYFLPKLTEEEMEVVDIKDYCNTWRWPKPDEVGWQAWQSFIVDRNYVKGFFDRKTFKIENSS